RRSGRAAVRLDADRLPRRRRRVAERISHLPESFISSWLDCRGRRFPAHSSKVTCSTGNFVMPGTAHLLRLRSVVTSGRRPELQSVAPVMVQSFRLQSDRSSSVRLTCGTSRRYPCRHLTSLFTTLKPGGTDGTRFAKEGIVPPHPE